ncbi:MAG TPA: hypothetical protein VMW19_14680 [Myxococcota bacterium]|nr:hypothetical protein [Myxococcota bacterium]
MRFEISLLSCIAMAFGVASQANAASCSAFAVIKSYDAGKSTVEVEYGSGSQSKFFPKPEGAPRDTSKIPASCKGNVTKLKDLQVTSTGGKMSVTQVRTNFEGKMLNDTDDPKWLPAKLDELIKAKTQVVLIVREGLAKGSPLGVTTLYLPATDADLAEIKRLENQAQDVNGTPAEE